MSINRTRTEVHQVALRYRKGRVTKSNVLQEREHD